MTERPDPSEFVVGREYLPVGARDVAAAQRGTRPDPSSFKVGQDMARFTTGQNLEDTSNGWNTPFMSSFQRNYAKSVAEGGDTLNWFRNKKDGVALWDDPEGDVKFGDVFYGGKKIENLYDAYGKTFADNVMRPMLMSATEQQNGASLDDRRRQSNLAAREARAAGDSQDARFGKQAAAFVDAVDAEKDSWDQNAADIATVAAGAAGGALTGTGTGAAAGTFLLPGIGTAALGIAGGIIGGITGAVGAWMNRDELQDSYARGEVQARMAEKEGTGAGIAARLSSWGGLIGQVTNPLGQVLHGVADTEGVGFGKQGDRESGFYATSADGELERNAAWTVADVATGFGAAVGQFGTGAGMAVFQAQMLGQIGGKTGTMALTGGQTFDDRIGGYDNVFLDDEGNFSPLSGAAGVGSIGIDVLQLGMARGLGSAAAAMGRGTGSKILGTEGGAAAGAGLRNGLVTLNGTRFMLDDGVATGARMSLTALAPSEFVQYGSTRVAALMTRRGTSVAGKVTPDELYQAAVRMSTNAKAAPAVMLNAFGEGLEEGVQALLEPISHGRDISAEDAMMSFAYGAAMGAGMTVGSRAGTTRQADREFAMFEAISGALGGAPLDRATFDKMSEQDKKTFMAQHEGVPELLRPSAELLQKELMHKTLKSQPLAARALAAREAQVQAERDRANPATDRSMVMTQSMPEFEDHIAQMSLNTVVDEYARQLEGLELQATTAQDPALKATLDGVLVESRTRFQELVDAQREFYAPATTDARQTQIAKDLNSAFQSMWEINPADPASVQRAKSVSLVFLRNPTDNPGSVQMLLPQVSVENSRRREDGSKLGRGDGYLQVSLAGMQAMGGDFDGDKLTILTRMMLDDAAYQMLRSGTMLRTAETRGAVNIGTSATEEGHIALLQEALAGPDGAAKNSAEAALQSLRVFLMSEVGAPLDAVKYVDEFIADLRRGSAKAKQNLFDNLANHREAKMQEKANASWNNVWFSINSKIRSTFWSFQQTISEANAAGTSAEVLESAYNVVEATSLAGELRARPAATATQQAWLELSGENIFRNWQALNYASNRSNAEQWGEQQRSVFLQMAEHYAALNSGLPTSKIETILSKDNITRNVVRKLERQLAEMQKDPASKFTTLPLLANSGVPQFNEQGEYTGMQTFVQWLLREEVAREEAEYGGGITEEIKAKHLKFKSAGAEQAFVIVFGPYQMANLLGVDGDVFGGNLTLEQVVAQMTNQDEYHKRQASQVLRSHVSYQAKSSETGRHNMPYVLPENGEMPTITPYQSIVDAVIAVSNDELTYDPKQPAAKQVYGRIGNSSQRFSNLVRDGFGKLWAEFSQIPNMNRRNEAQVVKLLEQNPRLAQAYLGMLSDSAAAVAIGDGTVAPFVVNALMAKTSAEAEMILWRGIKLSEWNALGAAKDESGEATGRSLFNIDDRIHLLMYRLAKDENTLEWAAFMEKLANATDLNEFVAWMNDPANGVRGNEAPYTGWHTDIAEVDPTIMQGRITAVLPAAQQRENLAEFQKQALAFTQASSRERHLSATDALVLGQLRDALRGPNPDGNPMVRTLKKRLAFALNFKPALGPKAIHEALMGNLLMLQQATDKGKPAAHVAPIGAYDMMTFMREFGTPEEARMASLTANSLSGVMRNPTTLNDSMQLMDDYGNTIDWQGLGVEQLVDLYAIEENRALLRMMFFPSVWESTIDGRIDQRFAVGDSLTDLLEKDQFAGALFGDAKKDKALYFSMLEGSTENHDALRYAGMLSTAFTSALETTVDTHGQARDLSTKAMVWTTDLVRVLAPLAKQINTESLETTDLDGRPIEITPATRLDFLREQMLMERREKERDLLHGAARVSATEMAVIVKLTQVAIAKNVNAANPAEVTAAMAQTKALDEFLRDFSNDRILPRLVLAYSVKKSKSKTWMDDTKDTRTRVADYVAVNGTLLSQAQWSGAIAKMRRENPNMVDGLPDLTPAEWEEASAVVITHALQTHIATTVPGLSQLPAKGSTMEDLKYFDPSYEWLLTDLMKPSSPLIQAGLRVFSAFNDKGYKSNEVEAKNILRRTLLNQKEFGPITDTTVVNMLQASERIDSSGAEQGIQSGGMVPQNHGAEHFATMRNLEVPPDTLLSTLAFTGDQLLEPVDLAVTRPGGTAGAIDPWLLNGRFIRGMKVSIAGTPVTNSRLLDLMRGVGLAFKGAESAPYKAMNLRRMLEALQAVAADSGVSMGQLAVEVEFFHPDDQPATMPNNLFFEGTSADGDTAYASLSAAMLLSPGGWDQMASTRALEANKKAKLAIGRPTEVSTSSKEALLAGWQTDLAQSLRTVGDAMMDWGRTGKHGLVKPAHYNALLKKLQMRHVVKILGPGSTVTVMSFEQARAAQQAGRIFGPEAKLVALSDQAVGQLHGNVDPRSNQLDPLVDMSADMFDTIPWTGEFTAEHKRRLPGLFENRTVSIFDGNRFGKMEHKQLANYEFQTDPKIRMYNDNFLVEQAAEAQEIGDLRRKEYTPAELDAAAQRAYDVGVSPANNRSVDTALTELNVPHNAATSLLGEAATKMALQQTEAWADRTGARLTHVYNHTTPKGAAPGTEIGMIYGERGLDRGAKKKSAWVAAHDTVVVNLDSFEIDDIRSVEKVLTRLMGYGADIVLTTKEGHHELRNFGRELIRSGQYKKLPGSLDVFVRTDQDGSPITLAAIYDKLTEMGPVSMQHLNVTFQSSMMGVEENSGIALNTRFGQTRIGASNIIPISKYAGFGLVRPENAQHVRTKVMKATDELLEMNLANDKQYKKNPTPARKAELDRELQRAINKMVNHLTDSGRYAQGSELELGDIIPLYDNRNDRLVLYRHGFEAPSREQHEEMLTKHKTVLYRGTLDESKTALSGEIVSFNPSNQGGLEVQLRVPIQQLGAKMVQDGSGFKIVLLPMPEEYGFIMPELFPNVGVDFVIAPADVASKTNYRGRVDNFQNAFTYIGIDFRPELAKFFFGDSSKDNQARVENLLNVMRADLDTFDKVTVDRIMKGSHLEVVLQKALDTLPPSLGIRPPADLVTALRDSQPPPEARIALAALNYLMWTGAKPTDILGSAGMSAINARETGVHTWKMPSLFTQVFEMTKPNDPLRKLVFEKLNSRFPNQSTDASGRRIGWHMNSDFTVTQSNGNPKFNSRGHLQFGEVVTAPTNPVTDEFAANRARMQGVATQLQQVFGASTGIRSAIEKNIPKTRASFGREGFIEVESVESLYRMLRSTRDEPSVKLPANYTAKERAYLLELQGAAEQWRQPLDTSDWDTDQIRKYEEAREKIARGYGFAPEEAVIVDTWVRQHAGRPTLSKQQIKGMSKEALDDLMGVTRPRFDIAMEELEVIGLNLKARLLPTVNASVPQMHLLDLAALYRVSQETGNFKLKTKTDDPNSTTDDWMDWIHIALAMGATDNEYFEFAFLTATDAMRHSYMDAGLSFTGTPITSDESRAQLLNDPLTETTISMSPHRAQLLKTAEAGSITWFTNPVLDNAIRERRRHMVKWRKENNIAGTPAGTTVKDMVLHGVRLVDSGNKLTTLLRIATHMRAANALLNPLLIVGAPMEAGIQSVLENLTNVLTGNSTGYVGSAILGALNTVTPGSVKITPYTVEEQQQFSRLYEALGQNAQFKNMFYSEFKMHSEYNNAGHVERWTGKLAEFAGRTQDPYYGMSAKTSAKNYMETVFRGVRDLGYATSLTPQQVAAEMAQDPRYVEKHLPGLHQMAMNNAKNIKCIKTTSASLAWKSFLDPLTASPRMSTSVMSTLFLRLPFMFANYGFNTATRILGLQGADAWIAAAMSGREKGAVNGFYQKIMSLVTGTSADTNNGEQVYDFGEVLEGVDLSHAFIKGQVSLTALFGLGLAVGSLGMTGEDEEDRRRRRAAEFQGVPYLYDPRDIANDFRNSDALFFDNVPLLSDVFRVTEDDADGNGGHSMRSMNFLLKQVMSPVLGMQRFMQNGNPHEVLWGFMDAIGSLPLINTMGWDSAARSYDELMAKAEAKGSTDSPEDLPESYRFMLSAVMTLERQLLENSFANQIYIGLDKFDRDPWKLVEKDAEGNTVTDRLGNPQKTGAMQSFTDPETGETREGYLSNSWQGAYVGNLTENRLTLALLNELVTLGKADALRTDMAIKTRKFSNEQITLGQAMEAITFEQQDGVIRAMWKGAQNPEDLNLEGFYLTRDDRIKLEAALRIELTEGFMADGFTEKEAFWKVKEVWDGPKTNPDVPPLRDIVWSQNKYEGTIPWKQSTEYFQLNTTYIKGPDGNYWATGVSRNLLDSFAGMNPLTRFTSASDTGLGTDGRLNSTDDVRGINTGMRSLMRVEESFDVPESEEGGTTATTSAPTSAGNGWEDWGSGGSGWKNFGRRGYSRSGGGGSGGGSFTRLNAPQDSQTPYTNSTQNISASNPIIRRATIRRERSDSDKGRLKPWQ